MHPYDIVREFEETVARYAGSTFGIAVDSCSNALFLCCKYLEVKTVIIPKHTHPCVPASIIHAGGTVKFSDEQWTGVYELKPYPIIDSARRFHRNCYACDSFTCLSFNNAKHLKIGKGGMILTNNLEAAKWFKLARYCGMHETPCLIPNCTCKEYTIEFIGWNMYMTPEQASRGIMLLRTISDQNPDLPTNFPDLSRLSIYQ